MESLNPCDLTEESNVFKLKANPETDFMCKYEQYVKDSAAFYYQPHTGDFTIKARLTVIGSGVYDGAFLMVRQDSRRWIKLAVELGSDQKFNVVSVITDLWSDDANGELLTANHSWVRITRRDDFFGLHYSIDGTQWRFVRAFGLKMEPSVMVGFGVQSPKGDTSEGIIEKFSISSTPVKNFRDGS